MKERTDPGMRNFLLVMLTGSLTAFFTGLFGWLPLKPFHLAMLGLLAAVSGVMLPYSMGKEITMSERTYRRMVATFCLTGVAMMVAGFTGWWGLKPAFGGLGMILAGMLGVLWLALHQQSD